MVVWGFFAGLAHGFYRKRPEEGWYGALARTCRIFLVLFLLVIIAAFASMFIEWRKTESWERKERAYNECVETNHNNGATDIWVDSTKYPGGFDYLGSTGLDCESPHPAN